MKYNNVSGITLLFVILWTVSCAFGLVSHNDAEYRKVQISASGRNFLNVNQGDVVRMIAPSSKGAIASLQLAINYVESLGLVANMTENIYNQSEPFYSNWDEFRANDLISALVDNSTKIIWCIRGGSGSIRLIPYLEQRLPATLNHKIFIGYSDITVLHLYLQKKYGWQTLHGAMLSAIATGEYAQSENSVVSLTNLIFERQENVCYPLLIRLDERPPIIELESKIVGGNAALVEASIGTLWQVNAEGKILFLEDVSEAPYSIERSLDHMKQSGIFNLVDGVIFSDFTDAGNDTLMDLVFERFALSVSFPVFRVTGIGHGNINLPLPLSTRALISLIYNNSTTYRLCVDNIQSFSSSGCNRSSNFLVRFIIGLTLLSIFKIK